MLRGYLEPGSDYLEFVLKTLIDLTADHSVFLDHIRKRISNSKTDNNLDNVTRYLLNNIDLVGCFELYTSRSTEIFDQLLDDEDSSDWKMLNKLYRKVLKECLVRHSKETAVCSKVAVPYITLPNLFHDSVQWDWDLQVQVDELIAESGAVSCNLYMVIETLDCYGIIFNPNIIHILQTLIREKGWSPVHYRFLGPESYTNVSEDLMMNCPTIFAGANSPNIVRVVAEPVMGIFRFITTSAIYRFDMKLPGAASCDMKSKCGFLIEVTGCSREAPEQFDIKLILNKDKYPTDLHCHEISADRMHLVLEEQSNFNNNLWRNKYISWKGKPGYKQYNIVLWGGWSCTVNGKKPVRLVAYYTV